MSLDLWTNGYQWVKSNESILSSEFDDSIQYYIPVGDETNISNIEIDVTKKMKWYSFDQYKIKAFNIWCVTLPVDKLKWLDGLCNCPTFFKKLMCNHVVGIAIRLNYCKPPPAIQPAVQSIDAVREVMRSLLAEHQQHQSTSIATTTPRGSRLNNTNGVNITEEDFLQMMTEKALEKVKKASAIQKKRSNKTSRRSKSRSKKYVIGIDSDSETIKQNFSAIDRIQLDMAIDQTERVFDTRDPNLL
jgi:hypothetical protein